MKIAMFVGGGLVVVAAMTVGYFAVAKNSENQMVSSAEDAVSSLFADPKSADFRNLKTSIKSYEKILQRETVCGEINVKNRFGGYVGFNRFVAERDTYIGRSEPVGWRVAVEGGPDLRDDDLFNRSWNECFPASAK